MEDLETIREFLIESNENLTRLDQEIVELEKDPSNVELVASIFRTIHTIKGTCGFLGYDILTEVSHAAESILSQVREGRRRATKRLIDIILQAVDAIKQILSEIEATNHEGTNRYESLTKRLQAFAECDEAQEAAIVSAGAPVQTAKQVVSDFSASQHVEAPIIHSEEPQASGSIEVAVAEPEANKAAAKSPQGAVSESTIRVDVGLLDKLMNLVGELVLARNQVLQYNVRLEDAAFTATSQRLNLITSELQENVMKTRMQPIGIIWNKFPRVVRDLAAELSKQIVLTMDGAETELDRTIIEAIKDPLTHIVRNSCDHGIESPEDRLHKSKPASGRLMLRAYHEGGHVNIEIKDDGKGLNPDKIKAKAVQKGLITAEHAARMNEREAINTIFLPGFSTAEQISNISGRGVGMDVVKTNIERIGGAVDLASANGFGTTVKIKIPLTLAIIPGLIVTSGPDRFVIPQMNLSELIRFEGDSVHRQIERIHGTPFYRRRGKLLPLAFLNEILALESNRNEADVVNIVVLQAEGREFGLVVDGINDTQEIVVKPLGKQLKGITVYSGATIMGDGKVALILDLLGIAQRSGVLGEPSERMHIEQESSHEQAANDQQSLLLFRAGNFERLAVPLNLVARLEEIPVRQIERAAGRTVVQYRGQLLPLVSLVSQLDMGGYAPLPEEGNVQVVVFSSGDKLVGLLVDSILDILEDKVTVRRSSQHPMILGSAVVGQHVTDFIDLHAVIEASGESWFSAAPQMPSGISVLLVEKSKFMRGMIRNFLEVGGYRVIEADSTETAIQKMQQEPVRVVAASVELGQLGQEMRRHPDLSHTPLLGLITDPSQREAEQCNAELFSECQMAFEREALFSSLERLAAAVEAHESVLGGIER